MKTYFLSTALLIVGLGLNTACAATWLDDGATVKTVSPKENNNSNIKTKNATLKDSNQVTLGTGEKVVLIGGVYVKAKDPDSIVDWAQANGYEARKDKYTKNAVHITTTAAESITVANVIAKLDNVTTAAPKYRQELVTK